MLTPFTRKFEGAKNDKTLGDKLKAEAEGILVDLLRACMDWRAHRLSIPASVVSATDAYRKASNDLLTFIEARRIKTKTRVT